MGLLGFESSGVHPDRHVGLKFSGATLTESRNPGAQDEARFNQENVECERKKAKGGITGPTVCNTV